MVTVDRQFGYLISCAEDDLIKIWDLKQGKSLKSIKAKSDGALCIGLINQNKSNQIAVGGRNKVIKIINLENKRILKELKGHDNSVWSLIVNHDMKIWNMENGDCLDTLEECAGGFSTHLLSQDETELITGCKDNLIRNYDLVTRKF
jgi:WD40 repeat protein